MGQSREKTAGTQTRRIGEKEGVTDRNGARERNTKNSQKNIRRRETKRRWEHWVGWVHPEPAPRHFAAHANPHFLP